MKQTLLGPIKKLIDIYKNLSLKRRISFLFIITTLIPILITVIFSYNTMSSILTNRLHSTLNSNLHQTRVSIENMIQDMNHISQQIFFSENFRHKLNAYLHSEEPYEASMIYNELKSEFNLITFSSNISLALIYIENEDKYLFNSRGTKKDFDIPNGPLLVKGYQMDNFGPHISKAIFNDNYVLSTVIKMNLDYHNNVYLYIESDLRLTKNIELDKVSHTNYLFINEENKIIYSENPEVFPENSTFAMSDETENFGSINGFYWFKEPSSLGWSIISFISIAQYKEEVNQWIIMISYLIILFIFTSLLVGFLLWKTIYKPIKQFNHEIKLIGENNFHSQIIKTRIPEFARLAKEFHRMKKQIINLIDEIEQKERTRADLEVEKLMYQINPHFLMNTLDTARWLAISGDGKEVARFLTALNKILYYNMGKLGETATLQEEIDSMEQYLQIQKVRYQFKYTLEINVPDEVLHSPIPRFILQPLVENAIYHGMVDDGEIRISIHSQANQINLIVSDNGRGIPQETLEKLLNESNNEQKRKGMGIGLNYVKRILKHTYGDESSIEIDSKLNRGTRVIINVPQQMTS